MTLTDYLRDSAALDLSRKVGLEGPIHDAYWTVFPLLIDEHFQASVGDASAEFHLSTPAERHNLKQSDFLGERPILTHLLDRIEPDDVFYDIGAQFGAYSCLVADRLDAGQVVAFEADGRRATRIRHNFESNGIDGQVFEIALADEHGSGRLNLSTGELTDDHGTRVSTTTVDRLVAHESAPAPTVVKIDVEGAELDVLRGMEQVFERNPPRLIYCETHEGVGVEPLVDVLETRGYETTTLESHSPFLYARIDGLDDGGTAP